MPHIEEPEKVIDVVREFLDLKDMKREKKN